MVALLQTSKMEDQSANDNLNDGDNKPQESVNMQASSDPVSPLLSSEGEQSRTSSPPTSNDLNLVEDTAIKSSASMDTSSSPRESSNNAGSQPLSIQHPAQLVALAATIARHEEEAASTTSSSDNQKDSPKTTNLNSNTITSYSSLEGSLQAAKPPAASTTRASKSPSKGKSKKSGTRLRRGKWTVEEEAYVARVIQDFNSGFLDAPAGTTLRTYLSEKLKCDPMRITKKFTGDACIGKRVFHPAIRNFQNSAAIDQAQAELDALERRWRRRLEMQQRESAKKAAASAAVAAAASGSGRALVEKTDKRNQVVQTASWLDRAKSVLGDGPELRQADEEATVDLQNQIQQVQALIHEGPVIQQATADLPRTEDTDGTNANSSDTEPADKRMRTTEGAEALVGFIRSVRASAANGGEF